MLHAALQLWTYRRDKQGCDTVPSGWFYRRKRSNKQFHVGGSCHFRSIFVFVVYIHKTYFGSVKTLVHIYSANFGKFVRDMVYLSDWRFATGQCTTSQWTIYLFQFSLFGRFATFILDDWQPLLVAMRENVFNRIGSYMFDCNFLKIKARYIWNVIVFTCNFRANNSS